MDKVKLDIYAGMRNSGKSTVIQKMFSELYDGHCISVIQNELGKTSLSSDDPNIHIHTLTSGCVCCSGGVFTAALEQVASLEKPEYIVLEPSGAADLKTLEAVCAASGVVSVNRCIYITKAASVLKLLKTGGDFYPDQLRWADVVYLNFADVLEPCNLEKTCLKIKEINPHAAVIATPADSLRANSFSEICHGRKPTVPIPTQQKKMIPRGKTGVFNQHLY